MTEASEADNAGDETRLGARDAIRGDAADDGLFVASLAKGLRVLECFGGGGDFLSLGDIAARAEIGKSATQRAVATLYSLGYLTRDEDTRLYRVAPKLLGLTRNFAAGRSLVEIGLPEIRRCNEDTGETVNITELHGPEIVCVARVPGRHVVTINIGVGFRLPAFATSPGLVMLAYESDETVERVLQQSELKAFTKQTVTSKAELLGWLKRIRVDGYAIGDQLRYEGEYSVAAPVLGDDGKPVGAVNISAPTSRYSLHDLSNRLVPSVMETARRIGEQIRHRRIQTSA